MTRRKRYNLVTPRIEEGIGSDEERTHFQLHHGRKGWLQVLLACGMDDLYPLTKFLRGRLQLRGLVTGDRTSLIHQCGDHVGLRRHIPQQTELFGLQFGKKNMHSGDVSSRATEVGYQTCLDRIVAGRKYNGDC